jgi:hypothetical protein
VDGKRGGCPFTSECLLVGTGGVAIFQVAMTRTGGFSRPSPARPAIRATCYKTVLTQLIVAPV